MQAPFFPNSGPAQQPVRVRLSCDSCSAAKVKCDKQRPACERCSSNQLHCIYSISRRHGCKRRAACEPPVAIQTPESSRGGGGGASMSAKKRQDHDHAAFSSHDHDDVSGSSTADQNMTFRTGNDLPDAFQYMADDDNFSMTLDMDESKFPIFAFGSSLPTSCDLSRNPYLPHNQLEPGQAPWTPFTTPTATPIDGAESQVSGYNIALPPPSSETIGNAFNTRPLDSHSNPNPAASNNKPGKIHDCEACALTLLRSLHQPCYSSNKHDQVTVGNQTGAAYEAHHANLNSRPEMLHSLDTILYANKCALSGVMKLLDCPCAQRPHLATLCMSIITKMLSLYEIAANTDSSSSESSNAASPASLTQNMTGPRLARTTTIQVGVFDLDEEDQMTLQRNILLGQLRKMEKAVEKFASLGDVDSNDLDASVRQWHNVAISMLKKELQRIYRNCKETLSTMG